MGTCEGVELVYEKATRAPWQLGLYTPKGAKKGFYWHNDQGPISQRAKIDRNCKSVVVAKLSVMSQYKSLW